MRYNMKSVALLTAAQVARGLDLSATLQRMEAGLDQFAEEIEGVAINTLAAVEQLVDPEVLAETTAP